ncbi:alanine dehydrogenase [Boudabousia liubingyangii]|uniref:Alanine dehydrogenase n=1 Tax=Boudabousia liubingyangii TaxID=1921764 RepID=A0A1Q5PLG2_9ACTO|nr:alanine dehydrogenase [Boudabousia liubingyangii]OKL47883.1 alanine dehydrogenase [Boudabousia liubingyangii]
MRVGVPTEVKDNEFRVALTPDGAHALTEKGHTVYVQEGAGLGSGISDEEYVAAGAELKADPDELWAESDLILKVKEPIASEYHRLRPGLVLFTYLHLAADEPLTRQLIEKEVTSIAYETVQMPDGSLPLLAPMSEIAGRLAAQEGAHALLKFQGGDGTLLGGAAGVNRGEVIVLGGGVAGFAAAQVASGMGANVIVFDVNTARLRQIEELTGHRVRTQYSSPLAVSKACETADLVIGSVLVPGAKAPKLVTNEMVSKMKPGSVLVDIAIDQGGCFEDSHPTTHADPTFKVHNSTFYCVANMPGAVPFTSTYALTNATMRYCVLLADEGWGHACQLRPELSKGLTTHNGKLISAPVGQALGIESFPLPE